ncbi:alpha/beta fold hydrolase [Corallococcus sp. CA054B]|uniref:alpha/beta fold hydrolase n=1 Tax=Corallococcus sp. CA054B TaxID=2316734 RepID=UPI0011C47A9B|nr:hypothetical protein [Corallococcus sp. CA054B]
MEERDGSARQRAPRHRTGPPGLPENAQLLSKVERLTVPTLAIAGGVVGDALARQIAPLCDHLETARLTDAAHILPEDQPAALAALLRGFARPLG